MVFRYERDLIEFKMKNRTLKFLLKCPCSWFGLLGLFSPARCSNKTHFFNWDSLHARLNSHCKAGSYNKTKHKKIKAYKKSLQKEPTVHRCLLILDLKPYPETTATQPSDAFLHFKETSLNTTWEVEHFRLFFCFSSCWFIGLELRASELFKCPKYWKRDVNLY